MSSFKTKRRVAPAGSLVWCFPPCADVCCCCSGCYNCCHKCSCCSDACSCGSPCPGLFFWFPCCCCCCRPLDEEKQVEFVVQPEAERTAAELLPVKEEEEAEEEEASAGEEAAAAASETAAIAGGTTAAAVGPRRRVVQKKGGKAKAKHYAAKSQPRMFTGAAAGCPSPPLEACVGTTPTPQQQSTATLGEGVYLVYKDNEEGGSLYLQWSKDILQGAGVLAYLKPAKQVSDFKFTKKGGVEKLCSSLQKDMQSTFVTDRRKYYEGWAAFVKQLEAYGGTLTLLPASDLQPPPRMRVIALKQKKLRRAKVDTPLKKEDADLVAIVPENATKFDVEQMDPADFSAMAQNYGAFISFMPEKEKH